MCELELESELDIIVKGVVLNQKKDIVWGHSGDLFNTRECYNLLEGNDGMWESNWKKVWGMTIPPKILIFL